eukprot:RCo041435
MAKRAGGPAAAPEFDDFSDVKLEDLPDEVQTIIRSRTNTAIAQDCAAFLDDYNICLAKPGGTYVTRLKDCSPLYDKMQHCCQSFDRAPLENFWKREYLMGRLWSCQFERNKDILTLAKKK